MTRPFKVVRVAAEKAYVLRRRVNDAYVPERQIGEKVIRKDLVQRLNFAPVIPSSGLAFAVWIERIFAPIAALRACADIVSVTPLRTSDVTSFRFLSYLDGVFLSRQFFAVVFREIAIRRIVLRRIGSRKPARRRQRDDSSTAGLPATGTRRFRHHNDDRVLNAGAIRV